LSHDWIYNISWHVGCQVDITRTARARGPTGFQIWAISTTAILFGFYRVGKYNRAKSAEKLETRKARYAMAPVLQAEEDRWYVAREEQNLRKEAEVMKNIPGWNVGERTYFTDRWVPRHIAPMDKNQKK
jgi:NADH dehydrogenase (ubiquinone) 1 alpha subcomplex subunit 13